MFRSRTKSFTLIELLIVVAIIGILAAIIIVAYNYAKKKADAAVVRHDLVQTPRVGELYYQDNNSYKDFCDQDPTTGNYTNSDLQTLASDIQKRHWTMFCKSNKDSFAVWAKNEDFSINYCVDSAGNNVEGLAFGNICLAQDTTVPPPTVPTDSKMGLVLNGLDATTLHQINDLGAKRVRWQVRWDSIQPNGSNEFIAPNFEGLPEGVEITLIINPASRHLSGKSSTFWANDPDTCPLADNQAEARVFCPPKGLNKAKWSSAYGYNEDYYNFVRTLTLFAFSKNIRRFIIQNEVNSPRFWYQGSGTAAGAADDYLRMRATAYKAIKDSGVPNTAVIDNGLASPVWGIAYARKLVEDNPSEDKKDAALFWNRFFIRTEKPDGYDEPANNQDVGNLIQSYEVFRNSIIFADKVLTQPASFDVLSIHYYNPLDCFAEILTWLRTKTGGKPIMVSEGGYADPFTGLNYDHEKVAGDLVKTQLEGLKDAAGSALYTWFYWYPPQEGFIENEKPNTNIKGLYDQDSGLLPAGGAWKFLNGILSDQSVVKYNEIEKSGVTVKHYSIHNPSDVYYYLVWTDGPPITINVKDIFDGVTSVDVWDIAGNPAGEEQTSITITNQPIYVKEHTD